MRVAPTFRVIKTERTFLVHLHVLHVCWKEVRVLCATPRIPIFLTLFPLDSRDPAFQSFLNEALLFIFLKKTLLCQAKFSLHYSNPRFKSILNQSVLEVWRVHNIPPKYEIFPPPPEPHCTVVYICTVAPSYMHHMLTCNQD